MTKKNTGRLAGFVYLLIVITGIFNLAYVPSQLIDMSDAVTTVNNIAENEFLFRCSIVAGVLSYVFFLILPFILFDIFKDVNRNCAVMMVVLAAFSVPISIFNMVDKYNVLTILSNAQYLDGLSSEQIQMQVMLLLKSYSNGIGIVQIFWGLWLLPFGYLVFKSGYIPKILGVLLMLGFLSYSIFFFKALLFPELSLPGIIRRPGSIGEIGSCLWLLIMGVKDSHIIDLKKAQ